MVTLQRFGNVSYQIYLIFFRLPLPRYYGGLEFYHYGVVISVDPSQ